jgi:DHA1 family bicyclomycin/chloramphenicol resistance-like MFS transporter
MTEVSARLNDSARRRYTFLLVGCVLLAPLAIDMYLPAMSAIARDLHASAVLVSATMSVFLGAVAIGQLVFGPLSDRVGRRPPILAGMVVYIAGSLIAATTTSITLLLVARILQAFGACAATVVGRSLVRDLFDQSESARFFSLMAMIGAMGPILAPSIGALILQIAHWRIIFLVLGAFGVVAGLGCLLFLNETRSAATAELARGEHPLQSYWALLQSRQFQGYLLAAAFNAGAFFTYLSAAPLVLTQVFGVTTAHFGLLFSLNGIGLIGGAQLNRWLLKGRSPDAMLAGSARNALLLAVILVLVPGLGIGGLAGFFIPLFLIVSSNAFIMANTMAGALSVDPLRAGSASALFGAATFGMGTLASLLAGALFDGTARGIVAVLVCNLLGAAVAIRFLILPKARSA